MTKNFKENAPERGVELDVVNQPLLEQQDPALLRENQRLEKENKDLLARNVLLLYRSLEFVLEKHGHLLKL